MIELSFLIFNESDSGAASPQATVDNDPLPMNRRQNHPWINYS
jgi:hypothetical protein